MTKTRYFAAILLIVLGGTALFASGAKEEKATLQVVLNQTWNKPGFAPALKAYEAANPNITIDLQVIPDEQFTQLIKSRFATGEYPDVYLDNFGQIAQIYKIPDTLADLSNEPWVKRLVSTSGVTDSGKIYGLPMVGVPSIEGVVYNKAIFQQVGVNVPKTWDEFLAACDKIRKAGIDPVAITAKDNWTVGMWIVEAIALAVQDKPGIWNDLNSGKVKFDSIPAFTDVLAKMKSLVDKGYTNKDMFSTTYDMGTDLVATGKAAMVVQGDWDANDMVKKYPNAQIGMFPLPIVANARYTSGFTAAFTIPLKSKHVEAAKALLRYFATPEQVKTVATDWAYVPAVTDVTVPLAAWTQDALDNYVKKGMPPIPEMGVASMISMGQLSTYAANMLDGSMKVEEVIPAWAKYFAEQAKLRKLPGWE
jgi:raffinose/stachyose/melibiose transport system substrate-binding protein